MIITVTMNPAIDKTLDVENFTGGSVHRVTKVIQDAGGKGINVSKAVQALGGETIAAGFLGGTAGRMIEHALDDLSIRHEFVHIDGETRTNIKVVDTAREGFVTEFNEPGPVVTPRNIDALAERLEELAGPSAIFVFSGSIPASVSPDIYAYFTRRLKKRQSTVMVDASGDALAEAIKAKPFLIKPNASEITRYFGLPEDTSEEALIDLGKTLLGKGINTVVISRGKDGALFLDHKQCFKAGGIQVQAHSTVGAGDAMLAALAYGFDYDLPYLECAKLSIAASAGACTTLGTKPPSRELTDVLAREVEIVPL